MMRARIVGAAILLLIIVGSYFIVGSYLVMPSTKQQDASGATASLSTMLPDATNNIHVGLAFDRNTTPSAMGSSNPTVGYVFGSSWPGQPSSVFHTYYYPYDRDEYWTGGYSEAHDPAWWKAHHPDWIEYKCGARSLPQSSADSYIAYEFSDARVPLDITNPAVLTWMEQTYLIPALTGTLAEFPGQKFEGIAFDNPVLRNGSSNSGARCGHYTTSGTWVQQFNGTDDDPTYRQAVINWAKTMQSWMHTNFPNAPMSVNFSFDPNYPADSNMLLSYIDIDIDESGFTNQSQSNIVDSEWLAKMQSLQTFLSGNHGLFSINQEPVSFTNTMTAQVQWAMANYLLAKNNVSYMYITGYQEYGYLYLRSEYSAPIGSATDTMYQSQNVYMRDFTNGKAIVNPSSSQSYTIALPQNTYQDLYGNAINSLTLGPGSGIVLVRAPTPFYRMHAESMTLLGRAYVISDSSAAGGQAVEAWTTGDGVSGSASFATAGTYTFTFGGREDYHNGDAHLSLYLDGSSTAAGGVDVTNTNGYPTYTITVAVSAGTHSFRLVFDNDAYCCPSPGGDRNAYIDYVAITAPPTP